MTDLQREIETLLDEMLATATMQSPAAKYWADRLDAILARCTWQGPWLCEKCGWVQENDKILACPRGCTGTLVPYERRRNHDRSTYGT